MQVRYIRNSISGSSSNSGNHWVQIAAWDYSRTNQTITDSNSNRALNKSIQASVGATGGGPYTKITNGNITTADYAESSAAGTQWVTVDLGAVYNIESVTVWHYYGDARIYFNNTIQASENNSTWTTLQSPSGNMVEVAAGNSYLAPYSSLKGTVIKASDRNNMASIITNIQSQRSFTKTSPSLDSKMKSSYVDTFYNFLSNFNVSWREIVNTGGKISNTSFEEVVEKLILTQNNSTCKSGCSYVCSSDCSTMCYGSCNKGCGGQCQSGCGANCSVACGSNCSGNCGNNCHGACAGSCDGACTTSCVGSCALYCSGAAGG